MAVLAKVTHEDASGDPSAASGQDTSTVIAIPTRNRALL